MKRRPRTGSSKAIENNKPLLNSENKIGLVLSGGGARAAYQVGALKALIPYLSKDANNINVIIGSSIGAINGLLLGSCLKEGMMSSIIQLEEVWRERTFRNTFRGSPSAAFFRAIRTAVMQYMSPGPSPTSDAIFDPTPLMERVDQVITSRGGLSPEDRATHLEAIAVMTTVEGSKDTGRRPLLFLSSHKELSTEQMQGASFEVYYFKTLTAKHGFASAALPSVLPPVELDTDHGQVRLVDGGISQNVPIDPAARLGAEKIIAIDISGRDWWLNRYHEAHDKRPDWEIEAGSDTFCLRPPETFILRPQQPLGPILKDSVKSSTRKFMSAVGPIWPVFTLLKNKLGEEVAYETMTYAALDQDYLSGIMERGYHETMAKLKGQEEPTYETKKKIEDNLDTENNLNC